MLAAENQPNAAWATVIGSCAPPSSASIPMLSRSAAANASSACLTSGMTVTVCPSKVGSWASLVLLCGREVPGRELLAQVEHAVEGLAGMLGEAFPLGQLVDPQPLVQQEVEIATGQQRGFHRWPGCHERRLRSRPIVDTERR